MMPATDYGGHGPSWINATYRGINIDVPEIRHQYAGPRSTVNQYRPATFSGMGQEDPDAVPVAFGPEPLVSVYVEEFGYPDITDLPEGFYRNYIEQFENVPLTATGPGVVAKEAGFPWQLLLIAGGVLLLFKRKKRG